MSYSVLCDRSVFVVCVCVCVVYSVVLLSEWDDFFNVANVNVVLCCRRLKVLPLFECDSVGFVLVVFRHCEVERSDQGMRAQVEALFVDFVLVWLLLDDRLYPSCAYGYDWAEHSVRAGLMDFWPESAVSDCAGLAVLVFSDVKPDCVYAFVACLFLVVFLEFRLDDVPSVDVCGVSLVFDKEEFVS